MARDNTWGLSRAKMEEHIMRRNTADPMLYEWRSTYYPSHVYTEADCKIERQRRVTLGQFVMQRDAPGGSKQFRAFASIDAAYDYISRQPLVERTYYETIFQEHPRQKPYFDLDIAPKPDDPMSHEELLNRLLTEIKRMIGPDIDMVKDVGVYCSHATDGSKYSYHVVLTGFYVKGNLEAMAFASAVRDAMICGTAGPSSPEATFIRQVLDMSVYKKLQQFRLLGSTKLGRERYKIIVLEYHAAGRKYTRPAVEDWRAEFRRSLVTDVGHCELKPITDAFTPPSSVGITITKTATAIGGGLQQCEDDDAVLIEKYRQAYRMGAGYLEPASLWFKTASQIVAHLIDTPGHLPVDMAHNCRAPTGMTTEQGALITLKAPRAGGYWCVLCKRKHFNENPFLTLHEDRVGTSSAATESHPRVVGIIYHCRREPGSTIRLCSMRGNPESGVAEFTCLNEPHDPKVGEVVVKGQQQEAAV